MNISIVLHIYLQIYIYIYILQILHRIFLSIDQRLLLFENTFCTPLYDVFYTYSYGIKVGNLLEYPRRKLPVAESV